MVRGLLLNRCKATVSGTPGTGTPTLSSAVAPFQSWSAAGAVSGRSYSYMIEDGSAWEIGTGVYNSATPSITRPGPGTDPTFASSTGSLVSLTSAATVSCIASASDAGGGEVLIEEIEPSGVGTVTFASIPAIWRDLRILIRARGTDANATVQMNAFFNNDTGANYYRQRLSGVNATASAAAGVAEAGANLNLITGNTATTNLSSFHDVMIYDYRGATFLKRWSLYYSVPTTLLAAGQNVGTFAGFWNNNAAITEIDLVLSAGNFVSGSVISLYGRK